MDFWKAMEKDKDGGPLPSNAKARPVPKTPKSVTGLVTGESTKRSYQSQTLTDTGSTSEDAQKLKPIKKWTSLNAPPGNAPSRSRSGSALRPQSMSVFESSAIWYTDDLAPNHEDRRWSVKVAPPSTEKKRPQWCSETSAPTVSVTDADSSLEERKGLEADGSSLLPPASGGVHGGRRVLTPPPKPPPPSARLINRARYNRDTPPNRVLGASPSVKQRSTQAFSPDENSTKMDGPAIAPSRSMENLKTHSPSLLSLSPTPKSYSLLQINAFPAQAELRSPSQLLSPVSPMDDLFVTASPESFEEVAFSALLRRWECMLV